MVTTAAKEQALRWAFFHDLFRPPTLGQWEWLRSEAVQQAWAVLSNECTTDVPNQIPLPDTFEKFQEEYIAAFEVGAPSPPCPLIESHWNKRDSTPRILHENMLFYRRFGLELRSSANETADHLRHQLEFIHYLHDLAERYGDDPENETQASQISRAKHDFIERHVLSWIPRAATIFRDNCPNWWASDWMMLLGAFVNYSGVASVDG